MSEKLEQPDPWQAATYAGAAARRDQLARAMPLADRFRWVSDMYELCHYQAKQRGETPPSLRPDRYGPFPKKGAEKRNS